MGNVDPVHPTNRTSLQSQARALGDPTRHRIFRYVADADHSVDVAELTQRMGLHHNAIRQHLAKLVDAGLVTETTKSPSGRGRPRLLYARHPGADSRWGVTGPYERLSAMLTEMVSTGRTAREVGARVGREHLVRGRSSTGPTTPGGVVERVVEAMAHDGFEPRTHRADGLDIVLDACPFTSSVDVDPDTICELHHGIVAGITEDGPLRIVELTRRDPRKGGCVVRLEPRPPST